LGQSPRDQNGAVERCLHLVANGVADWPHRFEE
jgi:hypothetical protein